MNVKLRHVVACIVRCLIPSLIPVLMVLAPGCAQGWHDPSRHTVQFISVEDGVRLEVLDWGGSGRSVVLLAGLGTTAHVFDGFAEKLADSYHVYGITRRGYGASARTQSRYSEQRRAEDDLRIIDALKLVVIIIGCDYHPSFQQIAFVDTETGELQERRLHIKRSISCASCRSVFCLRTRFALISAASPIHNSSCSSESSRSNQRACPLASIPTRTFIPCAARSR
jgi:hypothetical protein